MSDDVTLEPSNVSANGLENDNSFTSIEEHKSIFHHEQLLDFSEPERQAIFKVRILYIKYFKLNDVEFQSFIPHVAEIFSVLKKIKNTLYRKIVF